MSNVKKLLMGAAGAAGGEGVDVEDVFSNYTYLGPNASTGNIANGVPLADGVGGGTSVSFNGSSDYLSRSSDFTSNSDGKTLTFSAWIFPRAASGHIYNSRDPSTYYGLQILMSSSFGINIYAVSPSGTAVFNYGSSTNIVTANTWNHILFSLDATNTSNSKFYINDVDETSSFTLSSSSNNNIDFTSNVHYIGRASYANSGYFTGEISHVYLDYTYRNLGTTSNRRLFIDADGGSTSSSTLSALNPIMYLPMTDSYSIGKNLGTGGDLTASDSPSFVSNGTEYVSGVSDGGMVIIKNFNATTRPIIQDTENGASSHWESNSNSAYISASDCITSFNPNGFNIGNNSKVKTYGYKYHTHTFRKYPKFFDVVQYTGNGSVRTISHNLGTAPGFIIFKNSIGYDSYIYHRSLGATKYMRWNETDGPNTQSAYFNNTEPTASVFTVGTANPVNRNGDTITAYLFAHNNNDGGFGPNGDLDIIKCDEYTGNGSDDGPTINLGFEPQFLIIKPQYGLGFQANIEDWIILDSLNESFQINDGTDYWWNNNKTTVTRQGSRRISATPTGFKLDSSNSQFNHSGREYIYIAIRKGTKIPDNASKVFAIDNYSRPTDYTDQPPNFSSNNFAVDFAIQKTTDTASDWNVHWRNSNKREITTNDKTHINQSESSAHFNWSNGYHFNYSAEDLDRLAWMWKRAPSFCDVVDYTGDGTAGRTINHNLSAVPEMMWIKSWDTAHPWAVYHSGMDSSAPEDYAMSLDSNSSRVDDTGWWNDTAPTDSVFTVGNKSDGPNVNGDKYVAVLFGSVDGVSKVGSYTGNGGTSANGNGQDIDCGFSNGAKFVVIKPYDASDNWFVYDTTRGIVAGNDSTLQFNLNSAKSASSDEIDPLSSGFRILNQTNQLNRTGRNYIFYAIAE